MAIRLATAGAKNTYTIVVTNAGPSKVIGAAIHDSFPSTFTSVTYNATQSGGASGFSAGQWQWQYQYKYRYHAACE